MTNTTTAILRVVLFPFGIFPESVRVFRITIQTRYLRPYWLFATLSLIALLIVVTEDNFVAIVAKATSLAAIISIIFLWWFYDRRRVQENPSDMETIARISGLPMLRTEAIIAALLLLAFVPLAVFELPLLVTQYDVTPQTKLIDLIVPILTFLSPIEEKMALIASWVIFSFETFLKALPLANAWAPEIGDWSGIHSKTSAGETATSLFQTFFGFVIFTVVWGTARNAQARLRRAREILWRDHITLAIQGDGAREEIERILYGRSASTGLVREQAVRSLGILATSHPHAMDLLIRCVTDIRRWNRQGKWQVAAVAAETLGDIGSPIADHAVQQLQDDVLEYQKDGQGYSRGTVVRKIIEAVGKICVGADGELIAYFLGDPQKQVRTAAAITLLNIGEHKRLKEALERPKQESIDKSAKIKIKREIPDIEFHFFKTLRNDLMSLLSFNRFSRKPIIKHFIQQT